MLVMDGIIVLLVYMIVHMVCQGCHDKLCHLHQKGCWFFLEVVIPALIATFCLHMYWSGAGPTWLQPYVSNLSQQVYTT